MRAASAAVVTLIVGNGVAFAAASPDQATVAETAQIEDVIVTARRVEETEQSVPISVVALSQKDLQLQAVLDVQDLQTSTPGLFVAPNSQGGAPTFAIRGAKSDNGTSPTVAVYIDDVPVHSTLAVANMVYDMQSISTLKGPQGTLFGADSTGGAIIFRPNKPTDQFEGYGQIGFGNYDRKEFQGMLNIPVNQVLQLRLAGEVVRRDGFETNITPNGADNSRMDDDEHESLRLSARLKLSETLVNDTVADYFHVDDQPNQAQAVFFRPTFPYTTFLGGLTVPVSYSAAGVHVQAPFTVSTDANPTWNKGNFYGVANTTTWDATPNWVLKNVLGYRNDSTDTSENNGDSGPYQAVDGRTTHDTQQWTLEPSSNITWDDGRWNNKTGVYIFYSDDKTGNAYRVIGLPWVFAGFPPAVAGVVDAFYPLAANAIYRTRYKSEALYDQGAVKLDDKLTLTAGLRYTYDQGDYVAQNRLAFPSTPGGGLGPWGDFTYGPCDVSVVSSYMNYNAQNCTGTQKIRTSAPSFTLMLEDQFADRKMLYASLKGGYLIGGFNNQVTEAAQQTFQPEKVTEFEGGLKADWNLAGRPFRTNVSLFYGDYRNQQRVQNGTTPAGVTFIAVQNAGSTNFYGADIDLNYAATDYVDLTFSWNHLIATYTNYNAALSVPGITAAINLDGAQEAQAPKDLFTASATLKWPLPSTIGAVSSSFSYFYRSVSYGHDGPTIGGQCAGNTPTTPVTTCVQPGSFIPNFAQNYTAYDLLPGFGIGNFTTDWKGIMGTKIDAQLWVKNLTNKVYYIYNSNQALQYGYSTYDFGDPRTFGVRLRYSF